MWSAMGACIADQIPPRICVQTWTYSGSFLAVVRVVRVVRVFAEITFYRASPRRPLREHGGGSPGTLQGLFLKNARTMRTTRTKNLPIPPLTCENAVWFWSAQPFSIADQSRTIADHIADHPPPRAPSQGSTAGAPPVLPCGGEGAGVQAWATTGVDSERLADLRGHHAHAALLTCENATESP